MNTFYPVAQRGLLVISGAQVIPFLQGLLTNDVAKLEVGASCYGFHLTPQGRLLFDALITRYNDTTLWLEVPRETLLEHAKQLHHYIVQEQLEFEDWRDDYHVLHWPHTTKPDLAHGYAVPDPRGNHLGWRIYWPNSAPLPATEDNYLNWRLSQNLPEGPTDIAPNMLAAEFDGDYLNAIDYQKGCYVGQELTARMHYKTTPKKRLYQIAEVPTSATAHSTISTATGSDAGVLLSHSGGNGLALLRTRLVDQPLTLIAQPLKVRGLLNESE